MQQQEQLRASGVLWLQQSRSAEQQKAASRWEQLPPEGATTLALADPRSRPYPVLRCSTSTSSQPLELAIVKRGPAGVEPLAATAASSFSSSSSSSSWLGGALRINKPRLTTRGATAAAAGPAFAITIEALDNWEWTKAQQYGRTPAPPRCYRLGFASRADAEAWDAALRGSNPTASAVAPPSSVDAAQAAATPPAPAPVSLRVPSTSAAALDLPAPPPPSTAGSGSAGGGGGGTLEERLERLHLAGYESRLNGLRVRY
jgi:hypothetical protein